MSKKVSIYDLETDMRESKFEGGQKLVITKLNLLPSYIQNNEEKYKDWLE